MVQEKRGMLRVWNVSLVIITFFLTIFGTFMTRSGVVQSVHAFGEDRTLAWLFTGFMLVILGVSFGLVVKRLPLLRARNELDSWMSREAAFLLNNWILLFSALFVLFATMFPTLSESITGERLTVGPPFFNKWMLPIGLVLLFLTGLGPLLAWRKSTFKNLRDQFMWPLVAAAATLAGLIGLGVRHWAPLACFALSAFVTLTIAQEFWRGANVRRRATGTDLFTALVGIVGRNKRRYGGYIVHVGIVLIFIGFAGNAYKRDAQLLLKPGEQTTIGRYTLRNDGVKLSDDGQKQMITAHITVFENGQAIDTMYPARWYYRRHEDEPTTEVAIRRTVAEDLYIVLGADRSSLATQHATLEIHVNPLVDWIWFGFGVLALGTGIALLPERVFSFALAKMPAEAAATTIVLLAMILVGGSVRVSAQHMAAAAGSADEIRTSFYARNDVERQLQHEIVCTCGTCGHANIGECRKDACPVSHQMRGELAALINQGKSHDEIIHWFVTKYGSEEMLGAPIDKGFNRLAWLFPYLLGASGAVIVGLAAIRWSRHPRTTTPEPPQPADPDLDERLDDELRNLD
jgi:cytochrome c-type biogenesis protein CcmF